MIFMTEILYLVFVIFINEVIAQFQTATNYVGIDSIISSACNSDTLDRLHSSFCMHMYSCELWNLSSSYTDKYIIAWRKIK